MRELKVGRLAFTHGVGLIGNPKKKPDGLSIPGYKVSVGRVAFIDEDTGDVHLSIKNSGKPLWVRKRSEVFLTKEEARKCVRGKCSTTLDAFRGAFSADVQPFQVPSNLLAVVKFIGKKDQGVLDENT